MPAPHGSDDEPVDWIQVAAASEAEAATDHAAILQPVIGPASIDDGGEDPIPLETTSTAEVSDLEDSEPEIEAVDAVASLKKRRNRRPSRRRLQTRVRQWSRSPPCALDARSGRRARSGHARTSCDRCRSPTRRLWSRRSRRSRFAAPVPEVKKPAATPWLVSPDRAASYEPTVLDRAGIRRRGSEKLASSRPGSGERLCVGAIPCHAVPDSATRAALHGAAASGLGLHAAGAHSQRGRGRSRILPVGRRDRTELRRAARVDTVAGHHRRG